MITRKEGVPMVIRKISAVVLALAVALMLTATPAVVLADPGTSVSIEDALGVAVGGTADVGITIDTDAANGIGSATITLTVDTAVVTVTNVVDGVIGTVYSNTAGGVTTMTWATGSGSGPTGSLLFATVTLQAVGGAGECSNLDIAVTSMYDATAGNPQAIVASPVTDGQFCISGAAPTPTPTPTPIVTPTPTPAPAPGTTVAIDCCSDVPEAGSCDVDITIETDDPQGIGSATITLTVNTAVVSVGNVADGDLGTVYSNTVGGVTTMSAATGASPGPTGTVTFATVTLNAVGSSGECSNLDIAVTSMYDATAYDPQPITPGEVTDCTFCIAGAAPTPTPTPPTETTVAIDCCSDVPVSGSCDVDITITTDDPQGIGSATITLTVDTAVVSVGNVAAGDLGTVFSNTVGGVTTMSAATGVSPGPTGTVTFATVTLNAVGSSGACSALDITVTSLNDGTAGDPQPITPDAVTDCTFCIGVAVQCTWTFPHGLNTDPSAVFSRLYDCVTVSLPTATEPANLISVWYYDEAAQDWEYFVPGWPIQDSTLTSLENGNIYQVIVQDACTWNIPQP